MRVIVVLVLNSNTCVLSLDSLTNSTKKLLDTISPEILKQFRPTNTAVARFYGLFSVHIQNTSLRPIVVLRGTSMFELAKGLSALLKPFNCFYNINECQLCGKLSQQTWWGYSRKRWTDGIIWCDIIDSIDPQRLVEGAFEWNPWSNIFQLFRLRLRACITFGEKIYEQMKGTVASFRCNSGIGNTKAGTFENARLQNKVLGEITRWDLSSVTNLSRKKNR